MIMKQKQYKRTQLACYLGFVTQAICANLVPMLFLTFHRAYDITFSQLALISTCFFITVVFYSQDNRRDRAT